MPSAKKCIDGRSQGWGFAAPFCPPTCVHEPALGSMSLCQMWLNYSHLPPAIFSTITLISPPPPSPGGLLSRGCGGLGKRLGVGSVQSSCFERWLRVVMSRADSQHGCLTAADPNFNQVRRNPSSCILHGEENRKQSLGSY